MSGILSPSLVSAPVMREGACSGEVSWGWAGQSGRGWAGKAWHAVPSGRPRHAGTLETPPERVPDPPQQNRPPHLIHPSHLIYAPPTLILYYLQKSTTANTIWLEV
jgi:hypothetical protein